ncbi:MAG: hypothetical protein ACR2PC_13300 [Tsuneonella suprasediminis]|nr:hypothetical protein LBX01_10125 [Altererythrobacter sp. N1]
MTGYSKFAAAVALMASASMAVSPLAAAEMPHPSIASDVIAIGGFHADSDNADHSRRWGRHYRRDRIDAGDVIGGLLVVGAIAAVASAVTKSSRDNDNRYRNRPYPDTRYPDTRYPDNRYPEYRSRPDQPPYGDSAGLSRAVDSCADAAGRNGRVDSIHSAERYGEGWRVEGNLVTGAPFTCMVGRDGRIDGIDFGRSSRGAVEDRQWSSERYAQAWQNQSAIPGGGASGPAVDSDIDRNAAPAYPGGPIGDEVDDGRYSTAEQPDFSG